MNATFYEFINLDIYTLDKAMASLTENNLSQFYSKGLVIRKSYMPA